MEKKISIEMAMAIKWTISCKRLIELEIFKRKMRGQETLWINSMDKLAYYSHK